jgi:signal transduction histidine kinase
VWFPDDVADGVSRVPVLPRGVAAGISVVAVVRSGHAVAAMVLLVCIPGTVATVLRLYSHADLLPPVVALVVMLGAFALAGFRTSALTLAGLVVIGSAADYVYVYGTLAHHPALLPTAIVLLNRPETALVLAGTPGRRPLPAVAWGIAGFCGGAVATGLAELQLGFGLEFGNGPAITLANYCAIYLGLSFVQRSQRRSVPDFLQLRGETRRLEASRTSEQGAVALLHDTVLGDLALLMNGPDVLDTRTTARIREDVATLVSAQSRSPGRAHQLVTDSNVALRDQMTRLARDFQWRGLSVEFTGDTGMVVQMAPDAVAAAVGALRACLENVLAHSGVDSAEIILSFTDDFLTWTVSDAGRGFDPDRVPPDRLGLRSAVYRRVQSAGGTVKLWSSPGKGTSVLFSLPLLSPPTAERGDVRD